MEAGEDNSRSTEEPTVDPVTSKQVMQGYRDAIDETVDDYYKGELTAEESHIEMERTLEKAQGEPESRAREEDQQAFDESNDCRWLSSRSPVSLCRPFNGTAT